MESIQTSINNGEYLHPPENKHTPHTPNSCPTSALVSSEHADDNGEDPDPPVDEADDDSVRIERLGGDGALVRIKMGRRGDEEGARASE